MCPPAAQGTGGSDRGPRRVGSFREFEALILVSGGVLASPAHRSIPHLCLSVTWALPCDSPILPVLELRAHLNPV